MIGIENLTTSVVSGLTSGLAVVLAFKVEIKWLTKSVASNANALVALSQRFDSLPCKQGVCIVDGSHYQNDRLSKG